MEYYEVTLSNCMDVFCWVFLRRNLLEADQGNN